MANSGTTNPSSALTPQQQLINTLGAGIAPQTSQDQLQYSLAGQQTGLVNQQLSTSTAYNNALAGEQLGGLGISAQQNQLQQAGLAQQGAQNATQQGFEQQQYALQQQQIPESQAEAATQYNNQLSGLSSGSAISGTLNTQGHAQQLGTLQQNYGFTQADIARSAQEQALGQQSEESGYGYSQEQLSNAQSNLSLIGKANGLSQQQVYTMLNYGNQAQAQGAQQDVLGLLGQQSSLASGDISNAGAALSQLGFAGGINALSGGG